MTRSMPPLQPRRARPMHRRLGGPLAAFLLGLPIAPAAAAPVSSVPLRAPAPAAAARAYSPQVPEALRHPRPMLSGPYLRMLRDELEAGRALPAEVIARFGLDRPEEARAETQAPGSISPGAAGLPLVASVALAPDVQVNDKSGDFTCTACGNRPLSQSETTIAALGSNLLAGWNNTEGFCTGGAVQGYGYSTDGGASWASFAAVPPLVTGGRYRGDPVHAVNSRTGDFYILGLYEGGTPGSGVALTRGHFGSGAFVIDASREIAVGGANFLDKPWMAVDSLTGNLYVTYSNFVSGLNSQIELIRSTDNGATWSAPLVLSPPAAFGLVQSSRPVVGPGGVVYVAWDESGFPLDHVQVVRSDDFGASFGPEHSAVDFVENIFSGAPGFRRGFGFTLPGIAVDMSGGPRRGRVYVSWDESVDFYDAPFGTGVPRSEIEPDDFFSTAVSFDMGDVLRGSFSGTGDIDLFSFSGSRGQTVVFMQDSAAANQVMNLRLVCAADTLSPGNYRYLAFDQAQNVAALAMAEFTLPADGVYYLRLTPQTSALGGYRILTAVDTPTAGDRARDHRDQFVAHSDDGATWSAPVRINDSDPGFDGIFPEITVDGLGRVHAYWHDFRDDPGCGALSYEYLVTSSDGGDTWGPNRRLSDVQSFWSDSACGSANQGDYQGIASEGTHVYPCWADSRLGDPDVFMENDVFALDASCAASAAVGGGSAAGLDFTLTNQGNSAEPCQWAVTDGFGRVISATPATSGSVVLAPGASQLVHVTVSASGDCYPGPVDSVRFEGSDTATLTALACTTDVTCTATTAVRATAYALGLEPPHPNPADGAARLGLSLSRAGLARLELFGADGARVRTLVNAELAAGPHEVVWDGRDDTGRAMAPGLYFARLSAEGRRLTRLVSRVR